MGVSCREEGHRSFAEVTAGNLAKAEHLVEGKRSAKVTHPKDEVPDSGDGDGHVAVLQGRE
jgi:hypothetical protein